RIIRIAVVDAGLAHLPDFVIPKLVRMRFLKHAQVVPRESDRQSLTPVQQPVALRQVRTWGSHTSARNTSHTPIIKSDSIDDQGVTLPVSNGMSIGGGLEVVFLRMRASVGIDVPHRGWRFGDNADDTGTLPNIERRPVLHKRRDAHINARPDCLDVP